MNKTYKNYFAPRTAAQRYAKGRPRFHSFVIERIGKRLARAKPFALALDAGCGTGLSSVALKSVSEKVIGVDISFEMLRRTEQAPGVEYIQACAEDLPFGAAKFDLITISQAIHWIDKGKFFAEADRVLKPEARVIAYDNYFQGQMAGEPGFNDWYKNEFLTKYPIPPRGRRAFDRVSENPQDFVLEHEESNENTIRFSAQELVDYLVTISNVIAAVENGNAPLEDVYRSLMSGVEPFFKNGREDFAFINPIWFLRRNF